MDYGERRAQILRAAERLFHRRPYSAVSISAIAEEAGVAKGLLHHYFDSKRELYLEVVREVASVLSGPLVDDEGHRTHPWARSIDGFLQLVGQNPDLWLASVTVGGAERDDEVASILDEAKELLADQTLRALGLEERAGDPAVRAMVRAYGGFVEELTLEWLDRARLNEDQVRAAMASTLPLLLEQVLPQVEDAGSSGS